MQHKFGIPIKPSDNEFVKNISFVVSTNGKQNKTIESIPAESEIVISTDRPLGRARNVGVLSSTREWVVITDDDITFTPVLLEFLSELKSKDTIIGLEAYYPSPFCIGRFILFHRSVYDRVGAFANIAHGDETEWIYRAVKMGYKLVRIPRESVCHHPHTKVKPITEFPNLLWLIRKHPDFIVYILKRVFIKMRKSSYDEEYV